MLPAYGRELLELRQSGKRPAQPVYVVADWSLATELKRRDRFALVAELPRDEHFRIVERRRFDFLMLQDLVVILIPDWIDWRAQIEPQVRAARPRQILSELSFNPESETAAEKVARTMERAERQRAAA
jgi:hypothetical protein